MTTTKYNIYLSFYTLYLKEVKRFTKVWSQTILGPVISTSLFLIIFSTALGRTPDYLMFLVPGLIMMTIISNAFANPSSSIFMAKINGHLLDIIMAPITPFYVILAYMLAAVTRALLLAVLLLAYSSLFVNISIHNIFAVIYFFIIASSIMGLMGILGGILSVKWDHLAHFTNLFITPFVFLSGTFYSITKLPTYLQAIIKYNPVFFMIDGFRSGFTGVSDYNPTIEAIALGAFAVCLFTLCWYLWKIGYKTRN